MTISNLMTTKDVARRLGVSTRTVQRRVEAGGLTVAHRMPGYRGDLLFDPADVDALVRSLVEAGHEDPQPEAEVTRGTPDVAADPDNPASALDDAAQLADTARTERVAAMAGPHDAGLDAKDDLESRSLTSSGGQRDAEALGHLAVGPGRLCGRNGDALVSAGVEERRTSLVGLGGTREETHEVIVAAVEADVQPTGSGSLARVGAPAGGRAGIPEPAPASTTDEVTR